MRAAFLLLALLTAGGARAQVFTEKVFLLDSVTVYEGLIIEQAPSKYIKIVRSREKDTVTVPLNSIWKLTKEYPKPDTTAPRKAAPCAGRDRHRAVYLEVLGAGGLNSVSYDSRLQRGRRDGWGLRAGIGFWMVPTISYYNDTLKQALFSIPLMVNYLVGRRKGFLELGAGITYFLSVPQRPREGPKDQYTIQQLGMRLPDVLGTFMIGYRHVPPEKGVTWGVSLNPLVGKRFNVPAAGIHLAFIPSIGVKVGYKFG
ncbi:hypothetical protein [Flaviaesturariibacter amylovorans]|uniref:DUF3575 domain-containing protein n=1 Tax=Flaviaesturariibacter amylovorans TaxID=1084520 RepID=A0ABP8HF97_9BACT